MNNDKIITAFYNAMNEALSNLEYDSSELTTNEFDVVYHMIEWAQNDTPQYVGDFISGVEW